MMGAWNCQEQVMSVWLQTKGEFFWVFILNEERDLELYKVMGETEEVDGKARCDLCFWCFVMLSLHF